MRYDDRVWVEEARAVISGLMDTGRDVVVTDVRFDDEAVMVRDLGGFVIEIVRPDLGTNTDPHPSEAGIDSHLIEATVVNNGTPAHLRTAVNAAVSSLSSPFRNLS